VVRASGGQPREHSFDHGRVLDAGDDLHCPAAVLTDLDRNVEDALQASGLAHGSVTLGGCLVRLLVVGLAPPSRRYLRSPGAVRREHPVEPGEMHAGLRYQSRQPGDEVQWLKHHVGGAIPIGSLQTIVTVTLCGQ
jgi:hypothetical protein